MYIMKKKSGYLNVSPLQLSMGFLLTVAFNTVSVKWGILFQGLILVTEATEFPHLSFFFLVFFLRYDT